MKLNIEHPINLVCLFHLKFPGWKLTASMILFTNDLNMSICKLVTNTIEEVDY